MRRLPGLAAALSIAAALALAACGDERGASAPAPSAETRTAFADAQDPDAPAEVWAVGDGDASGAGEVVVQRIEAGDADRVLYLGDVYEDGTAKEFRENFEPTFGRVAHITAPTPGNHDWPNHDTGYDPYWRSKTGAPTPHWYAFEIGGWTVVSLNSEGDAGEDSAQVRWLEQELARHGGNCTIAMLHRGRFSAGEHGDQDDVEPIWSALRGRARIMVSGHEHHMQRLRPVDGIVPVISGSGGRNLYDVDEDDPRLAWSDDTQPGVLRLRLEPGRADLAFFAPEGPALDRSSVTCRPG